MSYGYDSRLRTCEPRKSAFTTTAPQPVPKPSFTPTPDANIQAYYDLYKSDNHLNYLNQWVVIANGRVEVKNHSKAILLLTIQNHYKYQPHLLIQITATPSIDRKGKPIRTPSLVDLHGQQSRIDQVESATRYDASRYRTRAFRTKRRT